MAESVQAGLLVGERLGKFEMLALLAIGGTAEIYLARIGGEAGFEKYVVVKCLLDHLADDAEFVRMFLDEARLGAQLDHSNIVQTLELGEHKGRYYMVMEYLAGMSLAQLARKTQERVVGGLMPVDLVLGLAAQACAGLHYAHERSLSDGKQLNIVHRDVSPQNLVVSYDGVLKIVDFGIAKADMRQTNTRSGTIKGKFAYMSPEQCLAKPIDRRTDIFALGVIVHELLTARRLFKRATTYETYQAIVNGTVPSPSSLNHELDPALDEVVMGSLSYDREQRYPSAEAFGEALLGVLHRRGRSVSASDIAHYYEQYFPAELQEHSMRMRELLSGSGRSIEMTWDASDDEVPPIVHPAAPDSIDEEIASMLETNIRDVSSDRAHRDSAADDLEGEATRVEYNPLMDELEGQVGDSVDVSLDSRVEDPAPPQVPRPGGKGAAGGAAKQTLLHMPAVTLPPAAPRPVGPPAGILPPVATRPGQGPGTTPLKPGARTIGPGAAVPAGGKPLPSLLERKRAGAPAPHVPRPQVHAPLPVSDPDEQRPTVTLTPRRSSDEQHDLLASRGDVSPEAPTDPVGARDHAPVPAGKAGARRKSSDAQLAPGRHETIRGPVMSVAPHMRPDDIATKTESPGAHERASAEAAAGVSQPPPLFSGVPNAADRKTLFAPSGAPMARAPAPPASDPGGNGQLARGQALPPPPGYGPPPSLGTDPGPDTAGRPQSVPPDTIDVPPEMVEGMLEGEIVPLAGDATVAGCAPPVQLDPYGYGASAPHPVDDRVPGTAPAWAPQQPQPAPQHPMAMSGAPMPMPGSGSTPALPLPAAPQSGSEYTLPPSHQSSAEYPLPPHGTPVYPQVQRDAFLSPGGSIMSTSSMPMMHSDLGRLANEPEKRPLWLLILAFLIAFGAGLGATIGIAHLIS